MTAKRFNSVLVEQFTRCQEILCAKAREYATEDRLHNFKVAASLENCTPAQALVGMMAKHTVSVFDRVNSGAEYPAAVWEEKITDHINYLLLLKAVVEEEENEKSAD